MKSRLISILFTLAPMLMTSCEAPTATDPNAQAADTSMFNIVYVAKAFRLGDKWPWWPTSGDYEIIFNENSTTFTELYSKYSEPKTCPFGTTCSCDGTSTGVYTTASDTPASKDYYDPADLFADQVDQTVDYSTTSQVALWSLSLVYKSEAVGTCRTSDRGVLVARFVNGQIILRDTNKDVLFEPKLIQ